jgi:hypothetical protein
MTPPHGNTDVIGRRRSPRRIDRLRPSFPLHGAHDTTETRAKMWQMARILAVALSPAALILILIHFLFGATIFDSSFSAVWNDERFYWLQIETFSQHGFSGGYYSYAEVPSTSFSHFGAHGPIYPLLFGSIAHIVGWHYYSAALFQMIILTIAIASYAHFTNLRGPQLAIAALVYVTFWPLMFFTATPMEEGLHYTFACIFAIIFYQVGKKKGELSRKARIACLAFFVVACLLRPTWSFLFLPFFVYTGGRSQWRVILSFAKAGIGILGAFGLFTYLTAPYPYGFVAILRNTLGFNGQLRLVRQHTISNIEEFLSLKDSPNSTALQNLQHVQIITFLVVCLFMTLIAGTFFGLQHSHYWERMDWLPRQLPEFPLFFHIVNIGAVTLTVLAMYDVGLWRDNRTIAPHILLTFLLLVTMQKRVWRVLPIAFIISNLLFASNFLQDFRTYRASSFSGDQQTAQAFQKALATTVHYEQNKNPWCNTLLSSWPGGEALPLQILGVPAGIGVSVDYTGGMTTQLRSKYLLASQKTYRALKPRTHLLFLTKTSYGNLYLNLDAGCDPQ